MKKDVLLKCIRTLEHVFPVFNAYTLLGLQNFRKYVDSLNDPLPDNILDETYLLNYKGKDLGELRISYKIVIRNAFKSVNERPEKACALEKEQISELAGSFEELTDLVQQLGSLEEHFEDYLDAGSARSILD